jgi:hypothetical protein
MAASHSDSLRRLPGLQQSDSQIEFRRTQNRCGWLEPFDLTQLFPLD